MNDLDRHTSMHEIDLSALDAEQRERWERRLHSLPPGIRDSLRKNLARVPADKVARILRDNEPMISKLEGKLGGTAQQASAIKARLPEKVRKLGDQGHYNTTVQPGDGRALPLLPLVALAVAIAIAVTWGGRALFGA
jgi:hypothetical protein